MAIGGLFAGESMYSARTDASKVALAGLVRLLASDPSGPPSDRLLDVQWRTDHLAGLGVVEVPREEYRRRLEVALRLPVPAGLASGSGQDGVGANRPAERAP